MDALAVGGVENFVCLSFVSWLIGRVGLIVLREARACFFGLKLLG
jgi:hypothetical protein